MNEEGRFFDEKKNRKYGLFDLKMAPDMGGDFQSKGFTLKRDGLFADLGRYSTDQGRNYYGYVGATPYNIGPLQIGGAIGAYGPKLNDLNGLAGLLMQYPILNGQARGLISPSITGGGPSVFFGFERKF